jgi:hypothetical protein
MARSLPMLRVAELIEITNGGLAKQNDRIRQRFDEYVA